MGHNTFPILKDLIDIRIIHCLGFLQVLGFREIQINIYYLFLILFLVPSVGFTGGKKEEQHNTFSEFYPLSMVEQLWREELLFMSQIRSFLQKASAFRRANHITLFKMCSKFHACPGPSSPRVVFISCHLAARGQIHFCVSLACRLTTLSPLAVSLSQPPFIVTYNIYPIFFM